MIFPQKLERGCKIAIVAPAGRLMSGALKEAENTLTSWGMKVVEGQHAYDQNNYFAGFDRDRLNDLQWALDDPSVNTVLFARGGYGTTRILDSIDFTKFIDHPKWLIGFSDITALHLQLQKFGIASIHGPMGTSFGDKAGLNAIEALKKLLFDGNLDLLSASPSYRTGSAEAEVVGGNLALVVDSIGTLSEVNTNNKILFLEEVGEKTYRVDRMLRQLLRAGKLDNLAGLVIGHFSLIEDGDSSFGQSWRECIEEVTKPFSYPVAFGFNIGHEPENYPIIVGGTYQLTADKGNAHLTMKFNF